MRGGVKVARRALDPEVLVRIQTPQLKNEKPVIRRI